MSGLMFFSPQACHQTYEWSVLVGGCGARIESFTLAVGDIKHDAEESLEDQEI